MNTSPLIKYLTYQLYNAVGNARKIDKESDIEYLHAFRVSIRRSRSLIRLCMPEAYAISSILKEIVQKTNELRELDVFLSTLDRVHYPQLTKRIRAFRDRRFETIWSEGFAEETIRSLNRLYDELLDLEITITDEALIQMTEKFYVKSLRLYHKIPKDASAKKLHGLRIRFKVSRYALEFLNESGLKNEKKRIKECKQIQEHFGDMQDLFNQLQWLENFCHENPMKECKRLIKERKQQLKALKKLI